MAVNTIITECVNLGLMSHQNIGPIKMGPGFKVATERLRCKGSTQPPLD